jgi:membrane protein DedA with SNARE-associated domain
MRWRRFFVFNALGGVTWSLAYGLAAYYGQNAFKRLSTPLDVAVVALAVVLIALLVRFVRHHAKRLNAEAERAFPG